MKICRWIYCANDMNIMCAFAWWNNKAGKEKWIILKNVIIKKLLQFNFFCYKIFYFIFCRNRKNSYYFLHFIFLSNKFTIFHLFNFLLCLMSFLLVPVNYFFIIVYRHWFFYIIFSGIFIIFLSLIEIYNNFSFWLITIWYKKLKDIWV